jgi:TRAP-type C4-dicarboxylate transport system substrate-binding protein
VIPAFKLQEMVKYHTETDASRPAMYSAGFVFAMNQAKYDSLPADLKKVIDDNAGAALSRQIGKVWDASQAVGRKSAEVRGNTFFRLSAAETDLWAKQAAPLYEEWIDDMNKRGLPGKQMLQDARDLLIKHKK